MKQFFEYQSDVIFFLILAACIAASIWLSRWIPCEQFDNIVSPFLSGITSAVAFMGAWLIFRHSDGLCIRKAWGITLLQ